MGNLTKHLNRTLEHRIQIRPFKHCYLLVQHEVQALGPVSLKLNWCVFPQGAAIGWETGQPDGALERGRSMPGTEHPERGLGS